MNDCTKMEGCVSQPQKESPIDIALEHLANNIGKLKGGTLPKFEIILASVLTEPEKSDSPDATAAGGRTPLESRLFLMNSEVREIAGYLEGLQNRIQL